MKPTYTEGKMDINKLLSMHCDCDLLGGVKFGSLCKVIDEKLDLIEKLNCVFGIQFLDTQDRTTIKNIISGEIEKISQIIKHFA